MPSYGICRRVALTRNDVSEKRSLPSSGFKESAKATQRNVPEDGILNIAFFEFI
jgi:hypothetical protein